MLAKNEKKNVCWWSQNSFIENNQKDASSYQSIQVWTIKSIKVCKNFCEIEFPVSVEFPLFVLSFYESTFAYIICYLQLTAPFILFKSRYQQHSDIHALKSQSSKIIEYSNSIVCLHINYFRIRLLISFHGHYIVIMMKKKKKKKLLW